MKSKINSIFIFTFVFMLLFSLTTVFAGYQNINSIDYNVQINDDGSINVKERLNVYIEGFNTYYKALDSDKEYTNVKVSEIRDGEKVEFEDYGEWVYHAPKDMYYGDINSDGKFEIGWGVSLENSSDTRTYEIEYKIPQMISKAKDFAELYWCFLDASNTVGIKNITGSIFLPGNAASKDEIKVWGHAEDLNGEIYAVSENEVDFEMNDVNGGIRAEVRVLFPSNLLSDDVLLNNPNNILEDVIKEETDWANEANIRRKQAIAEAEKSAKRRKIISSIFNKVIILTIVTVFYFNIKKGKKMLKKEEDMNLEQKYDYYREIPRDDATPLEANTIINERVMGLSTYEIGNIFSATILNLKLKGYVDFQINENSRINEKVQIVLIQNENNETGLQADENIVYSFLKKIEDKYSKINNKTIRKYIENHESESMEFVNKLSSISKEVLVEKGIVDKDKRHDCISMQVMTAVYSVILMFAIPVCIFRAVEINNLFTNVLGGLVFIVALIGLIYTIYVSKKATPFTQKGLEENLKWKGLKKYMEDYSLLKEREVPEIVLWEKYLVYATSFGIAKKVLKQIKAIHPEYWDTTSSMYPIIYMNDVFTRTNFASTFNTAYSTTTSSGSGSGGGFSGGGGGGSSGGSYGGR